MTWMKAKVSLRLVGDDLDPEALTAALGCAPTRSHRKGDQLETKRFVRVAPIGVWLLESDCRDDLEQAMTRLLDQVCGDVSVWEKLTSETRAEFYVGIFSDSVQTGFGVSAQLLKRISLLGVSIAFDVYQTATSREAGE